MPVLYLTACVKKLFESFQNLNDIKDGFDWIFLQQIDFILKPIYIMFRVEILGN
jgi:hypothetical protein